MRKGWGVGFLLTGKVLLTATQDILKWWIRGLELRASSMRRGSQKKIQGAPTIVEGYSATHWHHDSFSISFQECFKSRGDSLHTLLITPCFWKPQNATQVNGIEILENWGLGHQSAFCVWFWKMFLLYCYFTILHDFLFHVHDRKQFYWLRTLWLGQKVAGNKNDT